MKPAWALFALLVAALPAGAEPRLSAFRVALDGNRVLVDLTLERAFDERLVNRLFRGAIVPRPQLREMFTVPADIEGADMSAGFQRFVYGGKVYWLKSGARYGYSALVLATRDLSRTLVYSVNSTDAKGEEMNAVAERIAIAALK